MANSVDPDQTAPSGAVWSGSALFAYVILSKTLVLAILGHLRLPYSKRNDLASTGSKFFHFRVHVDPFWEGIQYNFDKVTSPESVSVLHNYMTNVWQI